MLLCIDYDITITDNRKLMYEWMSVATKLDYTIIICTLRCFEDENNEELKELSKKYKVYFTNREKKAVYLSRLSIYPDIWIDDTPQNI
jgi:hypothetical protein